MMVLPKAPSEESKEIAEDGKRVAVTVTGPSKRKLHIFPTLSVITLLLTLICIICIAATHLCISYKESFEKDEEVQLPEFTAHRTGKFVVDSYTNQKGIVDIQGGRCFLMDLTDVTSKKMEYFAEDVEMMIRNGLMKGELVRPDLRADVPPIPLEYVARPIQKTCEGMPIYLVKEGPLKIVVRRLAPDQESESCAKFFDVDGKVEPMEICDYGHVLEFEKNKK